LDEEIEQAEHNGRNEAYEEFEKRGHKINSWVTNPTRGGASSSVMPVGI